MSLTTDFSQTNLKLPPLEYTGHDVFPERLLEYLFAQFLPSTTDRLCEDVWPAYISSIDGLPSMRLAVPEYDAIRHHTEAYYERLLMLGKLNVKRIIVKVMIHTAFQSVGIQNDGEDGVKLCADFMNK